MSRTGRQHIRFFTNVYTKKVPIKKGFYKTEDPHNRELAIHK